MAGAMFAPPCKDGATGLPLDHPGEGRLVSPAGQAVVAHCRAHAQGIIDEYRELLGVHWTFEPFT